MKIIILFFCLFLHFSTVFSSKEDNDAFVAFVQGPANFGTFCTEKGINNVQTKNALAQFYGLSFGVLYRLKRDWHCENIKKEAPEWFDKDKCEYFGKCLVVLYEYLANLRAGHEVTRPIFKEGKNEITFVAVLDRLAWICNNFLNDSKLISEENVQKWDGMSGFFQIRLLNEVNYERNAESAEEAAIFEKILVKLYKKAKEWVKLEKGLKKRKSAASFYDIILDTPAFYIDDAVDDGQFIAFLEDEENLNNSEAVQPITDTNISDYKIFLGLLYLMKSNWHCANAKPTKSANECGKFRHYLDILYEYFLRVRFGLPVVKPTFQTVGEIRPNIQNLHYVIKSLNDFSKSFFGMDNDDEIPSPNIDLTNENELNYEITEFSKMTLEEHVVKMAEEATHSAANEIQQINGQRLLGFLRHKFDKELKAMLKMGIEMASEIKSELDEWKKKEKEGIPIDIDSDFMEKTSDYLWVFLEFSISPFFNISEWVFWAPGH